MVLGGHWWTLPRDQGFISGCPVQHQSMKRHFGADVAQIRGRQSAPPAQIPAHSEGQGSQQKPTGFRCVLSEDTCHRLYVAPLTFLQGLPQALCGRVAPGCDFVPWMGWGPGCSEGSYGKGAPFRLFSHCHAHSLHLCTPCVGTTQLTHGCLPGGIGTSERIPTLFTCASERWDGYEGWGGGMRFLPDSGQVMESSL